MFYGPHSKQEFYSDVLRALDDCSNKSHKDVVDSLLNYKYSWKNMRSYYMRCYLTLHPAYAAYIDTWKKGSSTDALYDLTHSEWRAFCASPESKRGPQRWVPAMQNKVNGAIRAMKNKGVVVPEKLRSTQSVDYSSLRSCK